MPLNGDKYFLEDAKKMNFDLSCGKIYRLDAVLAFSVVSAIEGSVYRSPTCLHLTVSLVMFAWLIKFHK